MNARLRSLLSTAFAGALLAAPAAAQNGVGGALASDAAAVANKLSNGGFETQKPSYWTPTGAGATWSTAQFRSESRSLALGGAGAASWTMGEAVRNWVDFFGQRGAGGVFAPGEVVVGAYFKAEGVNVNPATDAQKFQLVFEFFDAPGGTNVLGQPVVIDVPQTAATTAGFVRFDNAALGAITIPAKAASARITFRKGASATGTMYLDDAFIQGPGGNSYVGSLHGGSFDQSDTWYYYIDGMDNGFPSTTALPNGQNISNGVSATAAHTGSLGLRMKRNGPSGQGETVAISQRVPVTVGEPVLISYWLRTMGNASPETIGTGDNNVGMTAIFYNNATGGAAGYGELGGVDVRLNGEYNPQVIPLLPRQADNGWTQYAFVVKPRDGASHMELRLRYWHAFTGEAHFDDVFIGDVSAVAAALPSLLSNGGFEVNKPSYWEPTGAGATWSTAQARSESRSLALGGAGAASWTMGEAVRNWVDFFGQRGAGGVFTPGEIVVGAYVRADGVNVNPTTDAQKFQLVFEFFDTPGGTNVLGQPIVLDLPQTASTTTGFVRFDNTALGAISLPAKATSARITFRKGASATGTMYLDDAFIQGPGGNSYVGSLHGGSFDQSDTWYYYIDGMDNGFPTGQNVSNGVSAAAAHTGALGLRMKRNGPVGQGETVAISQRVAATPGQPVLVSFWTRTAGNVSPETIGTGDNNIGMTTLWYNNATGGAAGYGELGGADVRFNGEYNPLVIPQQPKTADSPWTRHAVVFYPREGASHMELRLRYWHAFTGEVHFDDVSITNLGLAALATANEEEENVDVPKGGMLLAAYPNPARGAATLGFRLGHAGAVSLDVYNVLGQRVASLLDDAMMTPGTHEARFDAEALPAGTYLYVLRAGGRMESRTLVLVK